MKYSVVSCSHGVPYGEPCDDCGPVVMSKPAITTSEKTERLSHCALCEDPHFLYRDCVLAALTTARKEAREAAFREARKAVDNMDVVITRFQKRSSDYNGWNSAIQQAHKAIEAAANSEEGEEMAERPINEDITELEAVIKQVQASARVVHHRTMLETEDGEHKSALALMELCVRSLAQANDAARFARHNFGRHEHGD